MSEDTPPQPPDPTQPQFNPQSAYPVGQQPPYPPQNPAQYPPNPYAPQPGQQAGMPSFPVYVVPDHPRATAALVVGIVAVAGMFFCVLPVLASPVAWVLGAQARRDIRSDPQRWGGEGRATAGMVLGIIGTVLLVLIVLALVLLVVVAVNDSSSFESDTGV
jgi:hypothetical protein